MKSSTLLCLAYATPLAVAAQFAPPAGQPGTTAIAQDSSVFVAWATSCSLQLGPQDIASDTPLLPAVGDETSAVGPAGSNGVVSLGDGGSAVLTFERAITNGPGWDFAVFENSFSDEFLELAFAEVSSNGVDFVRFPATSNTDTGVQVNAFGSIDATRIDNLAGKYRGGFGTPFDLDDVAGSIGLDPDGITHVRIVDVVGCVQPTYATYDHSGRIVNDPWSTPFASSGFDLDAVGVINQVSVGFDDHRSNGSLMLFPNPASRVVHVQVGGGASRTDGLTLFDASGRVAMEYREPLPDGALTLDIGHLPGGTYVLRIIDNEGRYRRHPLIIHAH